ncbi:MAG: hypothetical protein NT093_01920 [Candidatus Moranbacteria bacterium]|nr:hypothetical protein [Candidatus Moranbacteria bacterium]
MNSYKYLKILAVLAFLCAGAMACDTVKNSHEADAKPLRDPRLLMDYDSIAQGFAKKGNVLMQATLVGQSKELEYPPYAPPAAPPQVNATPAIPQEMPQELKDAKLRWVPPQQPPVCSPPAPPTPPPAPPRRPQPYVLATASHGGYTGAVEITKATLNFLAQVGASYLAPGTKINMSMTGANALANAVNKNDINQQQWEQMTAVQQTKFMANLAANSSSSADAAAAAKVPGGKK